METATTSHKIASREEWLGARAALLEREKEHTRISAAAPRASMGTG